MKKIFLFVVFWALFFSGCVDKKPIPTLTKQYTTINMFASEVKIIDRSLLTPSKLGFMAENENHLPYRIEQLKDEVKKIIQNTVRAGGGDYKVIVNIEDVDIYETMSSAKQIPIPFLFIGIEEKVVSSVSLNIEVEDKNGRVIAYTPAIRVREEIKTPLATYDEAVRAYSQNMNNVLDKLHEEIKKQVNRALYNYLNSKI